MYTLYKFPFLNGISEINKLFDDILIIWPAPVYYIHISLLIIFCIIEYVTNKRTLKVLIVVWIFGNPLHTFLSKLSNMIKINLFWQIICDCSVSVPTNFQNLKLHK